jgi:hypothetical protein
MPVDRKVSAAGNHIARLRQAFLSAGALYHKQQKETMKNAFM